MDGENVILKESCFKPALCMIVTRCFKHGKLFFRQKLMPYIESTFSLDIRSANA
jgi:hypothetical protein